MPFLIHFSYLHPAAKAQQQFSGQHSGFQPRGARQVKWNTLHLGGEKSINEVIPSFSKHWIKKRKLLGFNVSFSLTSFKVLNEAEKPKWKITLPVNFSIHQSCYEKQEDWAVSPTPVLYTFFSIAGELKYYFSVILKKHLSDPCPELWHGTWKAGSEGLPAVSFLGHSSGPWGTEEFDFCQTHNWIEREITEGAQKRAGLCAVGHLQDEWQTRPRGHKTRTCTWQKECSTESKWQWFSWQPGLRGARAAVWTLQHPPGAELAPSRESEGIRGQNQWKFIVRQGPLGCSQAPWDLVCWVGILECCVWEGLQK